MQMASRTRRTPRATLIALCAVTLAIACGETANGPAEGVGDPPAPPSSQPVDAGTTGPDRSDDGFESEPDGVDFRVDADVPDGSVSELDESVPELDESVPELDESVPELDESVPELDESVPEADAVPPEPDVRVPELDASPPDCVGLECGAPPGGPCIADDDCAGDVPVCIPAVDEAGATGFLDGYCLALDCDAARPCPNGGVCVVVGDDGRMGCVGACEADADCRPGYACLQGGVCLPAPVCEPAPEGCDGLDEDCDGRVDEGRGLCGDGVCIEGRCDFCGGLDESGRCDGGLAEWCVGGRRSWADCATVGFVCGEVPGLGATCLGESGAPCLSSDHCVPDGVCIPEVDQDGPTGFTGGLCIEFNCAEDRDCGQGSGCFGIDDQGTTACLTRCGGDADCRPGYMCVDGVACWPAQLDDCVGERCNGADDDCDGQVDEGACGVTGCTDILACETGRCIVDRPTGWCEVECVDDADCPAEARCIGFGGDRSFCLDACGPDSPCPSGWACLPGGACWLDCTYTGCGEGQQCDEDGQCVGAEPILRIDISLVGVEIFPVNRLSGDEPWDGPGGALLDLFLDLAQGVASTYLDAKVCKVAEGEVPFVGDEVGNACRDAVERLLEAARDLVESLIGGLFAAIEPPDAEGTVTLGGGGPFESRPLREIADSYSPNWNVGFFGVEPSAELSLTVSLTDVDVLFDDVIGTVALTAEDLATAYGEGVPLPIATVDRGNGNIVVIEVRVSPAP